MNAPTHAFSPARHCSFCSHAVALLAFLGVSTYPSLAQAQADIPDAFAQNKSLGRGVNVLGYDPLWRNPARARFQEKHFGIIKSGGFDSIRVNLQPFRAMGPAPDYTLSDDWLKTLDWIVTGARAANLNVILDLHEFNTLARDAGGNRARFLSFWKQIAPRFKDAPPSLMFEILNEPNGQLTPMLWNDFLAEALAIIRQSNPQRTVIIGPAFWNSVDHLDELKLPDNDRHLIVTVHYYKPMSFTHQGAAWAGFRDKLGVDWTATPAEQAAVNRDFDKVQAWAKAHNRPILLGEFGAYDKAPMPARVRYTSFVARAAERRGWSWAYWQFDSDFIVYDIRNDRWVQPIHDALIPPAGADLGDLESHADVGQVDRPGAVHYSPATHAYRVTGSGANIWGAADAFQFVYRGLSGDATLTSTIAFAGEGANVHRKACLMFRQSLDADAPYVDVAVHGDGLISLQYRREKGGETAELQSPLKAPATVSLQRKGNTFTLTVTPLDKPAQQTAPLTLNLSDPLYVGLAVSSHDAATSETATFTNTTLVH